MRSLTSLREWMRVLLPSASVEAREGAWQLVRSFLADFTVNLCGLSRQCPRTTSARSSRQYLFRWLQRKAWDPEELYTRLFQLWPPAVRRLRQIPLLIDGTVLGEGWFVLQISIPWQQRALPIYRKVVSYRLPEAGQTELLYQALAWLKKHLPGPQSRYVLVMDRGFPSHLLLKDLQAEGWRYVIRIGGNWRVTHRSYTGRGDAAWGKGRPAERQVGWYPGATLGQRRKGRDKWSETHVVVLADPAHKDVWVLATTESSAEGAIAIYRQRMQIEAGFRDVKGPWGLDHLETWRDRDRVARLLAWVAVYEWRLAWLWLTEPLEEWGRKYLQVGGRLSWIRIVREWLKRHLALALGKRTLVRESP